MWASSVFSLENNKSFVAPKYATYYNKSSAAPKPMVSPKPASVRRVISFHSSATWRRHFEASKTTNKLFTAAWCGPCRKMEPIIDEFAAKYIDVEFVKIDVDSLFDVSCEYGVQTMPTFLLMKTGKVIDKVTGTRKDELQMKIEKFKANSSSIF